MYANNHAHYQTQAVETAGPAQLVLMLYDRALVGLLRARQNMDGGSRELVNFELQRAQAIVTELLVTLDHSAGGQIAANLASLYNFVLERLVEANVRRDAAIVEEVEPLLRQLRDTWAEACCGMAPAVA